jgi:hypothetical protein
VADIWPTDICLTGICLW